MVLSYLINPRFRKFPSNLVLMTSVAVHLVAWGVVLPSMMGDERMWCDHTDVATPEVTFSSDTAKVSFQETLSFFNNPLCALQGNNLFPPSLSNSSLQLVGAILQFSILASTYWWCQIGLNSMLQVPN